MLTHAMKDKFRRSNSYSQTIMRIIFPDRWVLQGVFNTGESGKERWREMKRVMTDRERMKILSCIFSAFHSENASLVYS